MIPSVNGTVKAMQGTFTLPARYAARGGDGTALEVFASRMSSIGDYVLTEEEKGGEAGLTFETDEQLAGEAYGLEITETGVVIRAAGVQGQRLALASLFQLLAEGKGSAPCCTITDCPRYRQRGVMLDVCRHFFPAEEVKRIIEQASILKLNRFHWHLSDDQGYRIESKAFPELNRVGSWRKLARLDPEVVSGRAQHRDSYGGFYTTEEIRGVVAYAAARGIEVIPEIDLPGHTSAILASYPQFTCSGEPLSVRNTYGVHERIFCAGKEEGYRFLDVLLDEVADLFPSEYFHIGGDEVPKAAWKSCPCCGELYQEKGFTSWEQMQTLFMNRVIGMLKAKGKTAIAWNDSAAAGGLDESAHVQYWAEMGPGESYVLSEVQQGRRIILSNADQFYCSDSYAALPLRATLMYEPNVKGNPVDESAADGLEMEMWTEWTADRSEIEREMYPRMLALAECAWTRDKDADEFLKRAEQFLKIDGLNILESEAWEKATISGDEALKEIAMSMMMLGGRYRALAAAEAEDGGQAGMVGAVTPDSDKADNPTEKASPEQMTAMIRGFVAGKMAGNYPDGDIDKVTGMILQAQAGRRQ